MKKLLPYSLVCVDEIEKWLNEMALNGYHLVKLNSVFATFEEGMSEDIKYLLVFTLEVYDEKVYERVIPDLSIYSDAGWQLVQDITSDSLLNFNKPKKSPVYTIYRSTNDTSTIDVPKHKSASSDLVKAASNKSGNMVSIAMFIFSCIMSLITLAFNYIHYHHFIDQFYFRITIAIPFLILFLFFLFKGIRLQQLKRYYKGKRRTLKKPVKEHLAFIIVWLVICGVVALYFADAERFSEEKQGTYLGDIENLITLEAIEGENSSFLSDDVLDDYYYGYQSSTFLMPLRYKLEEKTTTNEKQGSEISLTVIYTKSDIPWHLDKSYKYHKHYYKENENYTSSQHFYEIRYCELEEEKRDGSKYLRYVIFLHNKNELIEIRYTGNRTPEEIIANVERLYSEK